MVAIRYGLGCICYYEKNTIQNIKNVGFMEFELPLPGVHIITGQNGVGKTTLFTCISRICNSNAYRNGFPSSKHSNMLDVFSGKISYTVDGQTTTYQRRTTGEWRPDNKLKTLDSYGYPEIVNITTKDERVFSQQEIHPRRSDTPDEWLNDMLNEVFNTNRFSAMTRIATGDLRRGKIVRMVEETQHMLFRWVKISTIQSKTLVLVK